MYAYIYIYIYIYIYAYIYRKKHIEMCLYFIKNIKIEYVDIRIAKNYQGITFTSIATKIYNAVLLYCIKAEIEKILWKNQNGFQRYWSTTSQILTISRILGICAKTSGGHSYL